MANHRQKKKQWKKNARRISEYGFAEGTERKPDAERKRRNRKHVLQNGQNSTAPGKEQTLTQAIRADDFTERDAIHVSENMDYKDASSNPETGFPKAAAAMGQEFQPVKNRMDSDTVFQQPVLGEDSAGDSTGFRPQEHYAVEISPKAAGTSSSAYPRRQKRFYRKARTLRHFGSYAGQTASSHGNRRPSDILLNKSSIQETADFSEEEMHGFRPEEEKLAEGFTGGGQTEKQTAREPSAWDSGKWHSRPTQDSAPDRNVHVPGKAGNSDAGEYSAQKYVTSKGYAEPLKHAAPQNDDSSQRPVFQNNKTLQNHAAQTVAALPENLPPKSIVPKKDASSQKGTKSQKSTASQKGTVPQAHPVKRMPDNPAGSKRNRMRRLLRIAGDAFDNVRGSAAIGTENASETDYEDDRNPAEQAAAWGIQSFGSLHDGKPHRFRKKRRKASEIPEEKEPFHKPERFPYRKNPEQDAAADKKERQKHFQKQRIKREYTKARRTGTAGEHAAYAEKALRRDALPAAKKAQGVSQRHGAGILAALVVGLCLVMLLSGISSCSSIFSGGISLAMAGSFQSAPAELDAADASFTLKEMELQNTVDSVEADHPGYDEYNYSIDPIGHDPLVLVSYLSAVYMDFHAADIEQEIQELFDAMYTLSFTPREENRTRTVIKTRTDPDTGLEEEYADSEDYTVEILDVELRTVPLETVIAGKMDSDAADIYAALRATGGGLQMFYTPLNLYWYNYVSSYYGYRKNPHTGENQFHRGVDIAVPVGTEVLAAQDGTVAEAGYHTDYGSYVVITDNRGYTTKYAHLSSVEVIAGQVVKHGERIGRTGNTGSSTGSHLHIECMDNGTYYNPLFYFENGEGSLYAGTGTGSATGAGNVPGFDIPADGDAAALIAEGEKYLGYPYVWGGSSPSTSFDCSGFVCWCLNNSGFYDMPRTTAQGIFDRCTVIDASQAQPGDLVFFTGTYQSAGPVSHIGIYVGNGMMLHCGNPIQYASINTPYWQTHFYHFGRLR